MSSVLLYVHRDHKDYHRGLGAQDVYLNFHTAPELSMRSSSVLLYVHRATEPSMRSVKCWFTSTETVRTIRRRGAKDDHLFFRTAPEVVKCCLMSSDVS